MIHGVRASLFGVMSVGLMFPGSLAIWRLEFKGNPEYYSEEVERNDERIVLCYRDEFVALAGAFSASRI